MIDTLKNLRLCSNTIVISDDDFNSTIEVKKLSYIVLKKHFSSFVIGIVMDMMKTMLNRSEKSLYRGLIIFDKNTNGKASLERFRKLLQFLKGKTNSKYSLINRAKWDVRVYDENSVHRSIMANEKIKNSKNQKSFYFNNDTEFY